MIVFEAPSTLLTVLFLSCLKRLSPAKLVTISIHVTKMAIRLEGNEERVVGERVAARWRCGEGQFMHGSCFHGLITAESTGYQCFSPIESKE